MTTRRDMRALLVSALPSGRRRGKAAVAIFAPGLAGLSGRALDALALLPIQDTNGSLLGASNPRPWPAHAYAGVFALDPFRRLDILLASLKRAGVRGVVNFPSVCAVDGSMRATLDSLALDYEKEVALVREASAAGFRTAAIVASADNVAAMASARCHVAVAYTSLSRQEQDALSEAAASHDLRIAWLDTRSIDAA